MQAFTRKDGQLFVDTVSLKDIADHYGTPCFVYSQSAIEQAYLNYANALGEQPGMICYAVKANSNIALLQVLARLGAGFDIVSEGELRRVLHAGGRADRTIFSGVGKTRSEMRFALKQGVACFNVESEAELDVLNEEALALGLRAKISLRVNPDVDAKTHPYISTGLKENKFGIDFAIAEAVYAHAATLPALEIVGVDCHIGSQLVDIEPLLEALKRLLNLIDRLADQGIHIEHLDLGGGLGVRYRSETPVPAADYLHAVKACLGDRKLKLIFEPGRSIVANAGALLMEVLYLKPTAHKNFAIVDTAMNDNIRPALYQAWQEVQNCEEHTDEVKHWDLVGPVCETSDFLAKERVLALRVGDRLAMFSAGAYCMAMSSNYNTRGRAAEVLVKGTSHTLIRAREDFARMVQDEYLLPETGER